MLGEGQDEAWCQPEEKLVSQEKTSYSADDLSDILQERQEHRQRWLGYNLEQDCLALAFYLHLNLLSRPQRQTWVTAWQERREGKEKKHGSLHGSEATLQKDWKLPTREKSTVSKIQEQGGTVKMTNNGA